MTRRLSLAAGATVIGATLALVAPAHADERPPTTVTFHVENAAGEPLSHIQVFGDPEGETDLDEPNVFFGTTNTDGDIVKSDGMTQGGRLFRGGDVRLAFRDSSGGRGDAGTLYALASYVQHVDDGPNVLQTIVMKQGGAIKGTVLAPSGRQLSNLRLRANDGGSIDGPFFTQPFTIYDDAEDDKTFSVDGLVPGTYGLRFDTSNTDVSSPGTPHYVGVGPLISVDYGQTKQVVLKDVHVSCDTYLFAKSTRSGAVNLSAQITGEKFGITKPGGTVTLSRGGNRLKTIPWTGSDLTFHLTKQPAGKKVSYHLAYTGGDCRATTPKVAVTVKR